MPDSLDDRPKRRGRPPGSRNRNSRFIAAPVQTPPQLQDASKNPLRRLDFKYADPETMVARQMSLIDHAQLALRHELGAGLQSDGRSITQIDIDKILTLCTALDRALAGMSKALKTAKEIAELDTPEQTLEKAVLKIKGQDTATIRGIIRRLDEYLKKMTTTKEEKAPTAIEAIAALAK